MFPGARIDVLADALDVEEALGVNERVRVQTEIIGVVIPAGVLAEGGEVSIGLGAAGGEEAGEVFDESGQWEGPGYRVQGLGCESKQLNS